ncbi:MAG TPA: hypothetical protein VFA41_12580 [Ktedonobacteraceae bacterium]|jgi:hypothetical protein|nr:hypothetical protein [Ktedonobacteraceae bacterium]
MNTYPIVLKSHPQREDVIHRFEIEEGDTEGNGFEYISTWLKSRWSKPATQKCVTCEAILELPDGSLASHLEKYQAEHGGKDAIVRIVYIHEGPGTYPVKGRRVINPAQVRSIKESLK